MSALKLWPAIDLRGGRVVRLLKGELSAETVYETRPDDVAREFEAEGADGIHVVDLDAAFSQGTNASVVEAILRAVKIPVEVGGGVRERADVRRLVDAGAARVVVGTLAFRNPALFAELCREFELVVALDCKDGRPTVKGWTEDAGAGDVTAVASRLAAKALLVTDVARDGAMTGPNVDLLAKVRSVFAGEILASGGMRGVEDLEPVDGALAGGERGVILGRALHSGATTVRELREAVPFREAVR